MPPIRKYQKETIIDITYEIVKKEGLQAVNARRIAKELNCSVQPIFHNFETMKNLQTAVIEKIYQTYSSYMKNAFDKERPYLAKGMAYIRFVRDYPEFFKILFMRKTNLSKEAFIMHDFAVTDTIFQDIQKVFDISADEIKDFHVKVWIFTHGIACLVATQTVEMSDKEIEDLLANTTREILTGHKNIIGGKK